MRLEIIQPGRDSFLSGHEASESRTSNQQRIAASIIHIDCNAFVATKKVTNMFPNQTAPVDWTDAN